MVVSAGRAATRGGRVVEPADRHVLRHPPPARRSATSAPERHHVRGDEHRVQVRVPLQQLRHRPLAGVLGVVALARPGLVERRADHVPVALEPLLPAGGVERAGDRGDPRSGRSTAGSSTICAGAAAVVGRHVGDLRLVSERRAAGDGRARRPRPSRPSSGSPGVRRHQQRAVDVPGGEEAGHPVALRAGCGDADEQPDVVLGERLGAAAQQDREVRVGEQPLRAARTG